MTAAAKIQQLKPRSAPKPLSQKVNRDPVFRLPFVSRNEKTMTMDWWCVSPCAYYHQNEEIGRVFCEEALRMIGKHPVSGAEALGHALKAMVRRGGSDGIAHGFIDRLVAAVVEGGAA